jgi:hypothetical protein
LPQKGGGCVEIIDEEVVVFKHKKHQTGTYNTDDKVDFLSPALRACNVNTRDVIDNNSDEQNKNILGYKKHVEQATGC